MSLFRSEEHIQRWLDGREPGATIPVAQLSDLAHAWWNDLFAPGWQPRSLEREQAILEQVGLTGDFWRLA